MRSGEGGMHSSLTQSTSMATPESLSASSASGARYSRALKYRTNRCNGIVPEPCW